MTNEFCLETERLIIRSFRPEDTEELFEILGDGETMQFLEPPYDREKTEKFLHEFCIARKGALALTLARSGRLIGYLLFNRCGSHNIYEIGWVLNKSFWRQGYAYEACSVMISRAFSELGVHKVFAETVDAAKSVPLMEKLGMKREGVQREHVLSLDGKWRDMYLYGLLREDFLSGK